MFVKPHSFNHKNEHKSRPPQCDIYLWVASLRSFISFFIEPHFCKMILRSLELISQTFFLKKVSSKLVTYWYLLKVTHVNPVWTMSIVNIGSKVLNNDYVLNVIDWNRVRPMSSLIEFTWLGNPIDSYITNNVSRQSLGYSVHRKLALIFLTFLTYQIEFGVQTQIFLLLDISEGAWTVNWSSKEIP